jgi:hypothetical protein
MARQRVRHTRSERDPPRCPGGERELDPDVCVQVLAVGDEQPVEAPLLGLPRQLGGAAGEGEGVKPDLDAVIIASLRAPARSPR